MGALMGVSVGALKGVSVSALKGGLAGARSDGLTSWVITGKPSLSGADHDPKVMIGEMGGGDCGDVPTAAADAGILLPGTSTRHCESVSTP
jgi:hypothetical protein